MRTSSTITRWQRCNMGRSPVAVGRRPCEPHYPTLLSLGAGSHLKRKSHPSHIRLVLWGDRAFPRGGPLELRFSDCIGALGFPIVVGSWGSSNLVCEAKLRKRCIGLSIIHSLPGLDLSLGKKGRMMRTSSTITCWQRRNMGRAATVWASLSHLA
jgi:hypothetical protein